jgi:hypothetical protein
VLGEGPPKPITRWVGGFLFFLITIALFIFFPTWQTAVVALAAAALDGLSMETDLKVRTEVAEYQARVTELERQLKEIQEWRLMQANFKGAKF